MTAVLLPNGKQSYATSTGAPLVGGKIFTYDSGTLNPRTTWQDAGQIATNTNPVILDARGEATIFWSGAYRVIVQDSLGNVVIPAIDGISDANYTDVQLRADLVDSSSAVKGADLVGFSAAVAYTGPSVGGFLASIYLRTAAEISAGVTPTNYFYLPGNVLRYGTNTAPGTTDMTAAFTSAIASNLYVYVPAGTYKILSSLLIPPYVIVEGAGLNNTSIVANADVVAFVLQFWSQLRQLSVSKSGAHTKNLVEVGSVVLDAGRAVISDVLVTGAGNDGVQLINGNLGTIQNLVSVSNTRDGLNTAAVSGNLNAWTFQGYVDLRANGRDGLHLTPDTVIGGPNCSKSNIITGLVCQNNVRYGVYVGTRSNLINCYAEFSGTSDVFLDSFARGNEIKTVTGAVVDSSLNPSFNIVENFNASAGYQRIFQNRTGFSGVAAAGWQLYSDDGTAGTMACFKAAIRSYKFQAGGSGATQTLTFEHENTPSFLLNLVVDGKLTLGSNTALSAKLDAYFNGSASNGVDLQDTNSTNGGTFTRFLIGAVGAGVAIGSITRNAATSAVLYNTTSDGSLKDITGPLLDAGAILDSIPVYNFTWKEGGAADRGVIAQELVNVVPQAVHVGTNGDPWGVDYSKLVPLLVAEVQELRKRVQALEG